MNWFYAQKRGTRHKSYFFCSVVLVEGKKSKLQTLELLTTVSHIALCWSHLYPHTDWVLQCMLPTFTFTLQHDFCFRLLDSGYYGILWGRHHTGIRVCQGIPRQVYQAIVQRYRRSFVLRFDCTQQLIIVVHLYCKYVLLLFGWDMVGWLFWGLTSI